MKIRTFVVLAGLGVAVAIAGCATPSSGAAASGVCEGGVTVPGHHKGKKWKVGITRCPNGALTVADSSAR